MQHKMYIPYSSTFTPNLTMIKQKKIKIKNKYNLLNTCFLSTFFFFFSIFHFDQGPGWLGELGSWITKQLIQANTNATWVRARLCKLQKGCTRITAARAKFTSCLPMVGGSLRLLPPLKLVAMI